ncbi:unnamed protein product [Symbiodinium natans]|uniref:Uncharacterized protein n=1 Tax=Symbiodinium natans TaxID=878477 RepID=A0A812U0Y7_9DINO|nr:unnamed protein product [Symbiodinium natans]
MTLLGNVVANDVLISSVLSVLTGPDLARLEMVSASILAELTALHHWVKYFQRMSHVRLAGGCLMVLSECGPQRSGIKALLCKLASMATSGEDDASLPEHVAPVVLGSLSDAQKLEKKLLAAEQKARLARNDGLATTGALIRCFQFTDGSVSTPISFHLNSQRYMLQLGWTTSDDVVLKVAVDPPSDPDLETQPLLSISISTIGAGPCFASRDSIVTPDERWCSINGICTLLSSHELMNSLIAGLWCVVCISHHPDDAPQPRSRRATNMLESLSLQPLEADLAFEL